MYKGVEYVAKCDKENKLDYDINTFIVLLYYACMCMYAYVCIDLYIRMYMYICMSYKNYTSDSF